MFAPLLWVLAAGTATPATTAPAPSVAAEAARDYRTGPFRADALALATELTPRALFDRVMEVQLEHGLRTGISSDASWLEETSPGVVDELVTESLGAVRPLMAGEYRDNSERVARLLSETLTSAETSALVAFYRSNAGRKITAAKHKALVKPLPTAMIDPDRATQASDIRALNRSAMGGVLDTLTTADRAELEQFARQPAYKAMTKVAGKTVALETMMANEESPAMEAAISAAIERVLKRRGLVQ